METSLFIAKILGPLVLVVAIGIMANRGFYQKVMEDFCKNAALIYIGGLFSLVIGILIVLAHNTWALNWALIITIFGWGGIIKGIWLIVFPNSIAKFMRVYQKNKALLGVHSVLALVVGTALTFLGYFAG